MEPFQFTACFVASAIGDALGAPVEFDSINSIRSQYGERGLRKLVPAYGRLGAITDDTQMAIATARGLISASAEEKDTLDSLRDAYLDWLQTQDDPAKHREPGNTCISALSQQRRRPSLEADNNSWGCGGIMRVHPVGMAYAGLPEKAFEIGDASARLTHGHPRAVLPSGMFAAIIADLLTGKDIEASIDDAIRLVRGADNHEETLTTVQESLDAVDTADSDLGYIESTEGGWRGDTALAISLFCFLRHRDEPLEALFASVNHSGDSDSTGTICGAMLGAVHGLGWIPSDWLEVLEHREELVSLADALYQVNTGHEDRPSMPNRQ